MTVHLLFNMWDKIKTRCRLGKMSRWHHFLWHWVLRARACWCSLKNLWQIAEEHDEDLHANFIKTMGQYQPEEIGFLNKFLKDECTLHQHSGQTKKGKCAVMWGAFVCGCWVSAEGLLSLDGIVASTVVEGLMMCEKFLYFLEHSMVSSVSTPCCNKPLTPLIDASYITISRGVELQTFLVSINEHYKLS